MTNQGATQDDVRTVYVPLGALEALVRGARSQGEEQRALQQQLAEHRQRIELLKAKTAEVEHTLSQYKTDHRQSVATTTPLAVATGIHRQPTRSPSVSSVPSSSPRSLLAPSAYSRDMSGASEGVNHLLVSNNTSPAAMRVVVTKERVAQLEQVMTSVKEISAQGEFEDVIARTLGAAQKLVRADKYTLGLLNERRNVVEIFSTGPWRKQTPASQGHQQQSQPQPQPQSSQQPRQRIYSTFGISSMPKQPNGVHSTANVAVYTAEGFVAADSATTFGRVIMTGKPLHIEDFYTHENYDDQIKSGSKGASPRALLCLPICNAHGAVVGVLQVVAMVNSTAVTATSALAPQRPTTPAESSEPPSSSSSSSSSGGSAATPKPDASVFTDTDARSLEFLAVVAGAAIWNLILFRERQTAQSRIEGLLKLHRNISMEAVSSTVLDQVLSVCHELIGTERIGLFLKVEGDEDELYIACAADIVRGEYVPITKGIVGHVARTGEMVITNDAYSHAMFDPTLDHKTGFVTKRILCLPVRSPDGHILAVVSAVNKIDNTDFSAEDAVFLNYAADAVGISLHKASLHQKVKTSQKLIEARLTLTTFISESADIEKFVDLVMEIGKDIMECDRFGFLLIDHFKKELWITPRVVGGGSESGLRTPMNRGISGLVATTGQAVCTRDAYKHELFDPSIDHKTGYRTTSVLCMPIFEDHAASAPKVVAVAMCINKKEGSHFVAFTKTDQEVMEKYCREVQFALGRLSLDISYYKVVYDCSNTANASTTANGGGGGGGGGGSHAAGGASGSAAAGGAAGLDGFSEPDIISSIVHKYYSSSAATTTLTHADTDDASSEVATTPTTPSGSSKKSSSSSSSAQAAQAASAASVSALLKKKHEDDAVPFPREIVFPSASNGSSNNGSGDESLDSWTKDTLHMSSNDVALACGTVFRAYGFLEAFRISSEKFAAFTTNVANYYRSNPFHNFQHAFQVLLNMHVMLKAECRKFFSGVEIFAMLVAALCHDVDHPGNTNEFELKTLSAMALTHNDDAVLERHHCRVTFIILNHKSAKILQHLDESRYKRVRQLIISCILATDMARHFEKCKALENLTRRQLNEKRGLLMGILMHAADLSFHALPFAQAHEWGNRLLDEFQHQAKAEADHGVATDCFMQHLDSKKNRLVVQLNLINYVARPIWLPLSSLCHQLRFYADELETNFELFQKQLEECRATEQQHQHQQQQHQQAIKVAATTILVHEVLVAAHQQQLPSQSSQSGGSSTSRSTSTSSVLSMDERPISSGSVAAPVATTTTSQSASHHHAHAHTRHSSKQIIH